MSLLFILLWVQAGQNTERVLIPRIEHAPVFSSITDMEHPPGWLEHFARVDGFVQREPEDGKPSSQKTEVYLGYDSHKIYVLFLAFDRDPDKVRAHWVPRERIEGDDTVNIQLDTFSDQRRGYTFICNPLGVQADALWTESKGFDFSFNALWESEGKLMSRGFVVLMSIPFKSLRFAKTDRQSWGVLLNRDIPRLNEDTFWPRYTMKIQGRLNQAAKLEGITGVSSGRNYHVIPFAFARSYRSLVDGDSPGYIQNDFDSRIGLDAKWVLKDRFVFDVTVKPDFSQVESDRPQITVNERFEVYFPERRPFFLENADLFRTPTNLVFTRRIADPDWGLRLTGKAGRYNIGVMALNDASAGQYEDSESPLHDKKAQVGIVRVNRDILGQSTLGVLVTQREFADRRNRVFSLDTRILLNEHWELSSQAGVSRTRSQRLEETNSSFTDTSLNRKGKSFRAHIHALTTGRDFESDLGFLGNNHRLGTRNLHGSFSYTFWKNRGPWISWRPSVFASYVEDYDHRILEKSFGPTLRWDFTGKSYIHLKMFEMDELLTPDEFSGLDTACRFDSELLELSTGSHILNWLGFDAGLEWGDSVNYVPVWDQAPGPGDALNAELSLSFMPVPRFNFNLDYLYRQLDMPDSGDLIFSNRILRGRLAFQVSRRLSVRAIVEESRLHVNQLHTWLDESLNLNGDLLVTYLVNPWTAFYFGFNTNERNRELQVNGRPWILNPSPDRHHDGHQVFLKCSYLIQ